jgi:hypothetical protein
LFSPNIAALVSNFNATTTFVATTMVIYSDASSRPRCLSLFVKAALALRQLRNFYCCYEVLLGCCHRAIRRLKEAFGRFAKKPHELLTAYIKTFPQCPPVDEELRAVSEKWLSCVAAFPLFRN